MRIVCTDDLHGFIDDLIMPPGDVLVCHARPPLREIRQAAPRLVVHGHSVVRPRCRLVGPSIFASASLGSDRRYGPIVATVTPDAVMTREVPLAEMLKPEVYADRVQRFWQDLMRRMQCRADPFLRRLLPPPDARPVT